MNNFYFYIEASTFKEFFYIISTYSKATYHIVWSASVCCLHRNQLREKITNATQLFWWSSTDWQGATLNARISGSHWAQGLDYMGARVPIVPSLGYIMQHMPEHCCESILYWAYHAFYFGLCNAIFSRSHNMTQYLLFHCETKTVMIWLQHHQW